MARRLLKAAPSRGKMKKIIIIVVAVVVLLGGAGAGVYFFKPDLLPASIRPKDRNAELAAAAAEGKDAKEAKKDQGKKKDKGEHEKEVGADLDVFVVNLAGGGAPRYLRTTLSLGVKDEHEKEKIKELSGKIRDAVIMYLTQRKAEELIDLEGKNKLREALHKQINEAVGDDKLVTNVYFKEFLIQ
jgi:flagellar protein FliL